MDELEISGRRYISTKRAGKDHKYHADYIGQLIRAKKVIGQKVGRSWYVDAESLASYLGAELKPRDEAVPVARVTKEVEIAETSDEVETQKPTHVVEEEIAETEEDQSVLETEEALEDIEKEVSHIPVKISAPIEEKKETIFYRTTKEAREARGGLRYIADEGPLLPQVKKHAIYDEVPRVSRHIEPSPVTIKINERIQERTIYTQPDVTEERSFAIPALSVKQPRPSKSKTTLFLARAGVVVTLGAIVFAVAAFASSRLLFTQTVDGEQSASVGYTLE